MKLVSKKQKMTTAILVIAVAVIALAIIIALIVGATSSSNSPNATTTTTKKPDANIVGINIASCSKTIYQVGENLDPSTILLQVIMSEQSSTYFLSGTSSEIEFSGFDSSVANENVVVTISYKGFTTSFAVKIEEESNEPEVKLVSIEFIGDFQTTYTASEWNECGPMFDGTSLVCTYSDGTVETIPMRNKYLEQPSFNLQGPCNYDITITYEGVSTVITLTITE